MKGLELLRRRLRSQSMEEAQLALCGTATVAANMIALTARRQEPRFLRGKAALQIV